MKIQNSDIVELHNHIWDGFLRELEGNYYIHIGDSFETFYEYVIVKYMQNFPDILWDEYCFNWMYKLDEDEYSWECNYNCVFCCEKRKKPCYFSDKYYEVRYFFDLYQLNRKYLKRYKAVYKDLMVAAGNMIYNGSEEGEIRINEKYEKIWPVWLNRMEICKKIGKLP